MPRPTFEDVAATIGGDRELAERLEALAPKVEAIWRNAPSIRKSYADDRDRYIRMKKRAERLRADLASISQEDLWLLEDWRGAGMFGPVRQHQECLDRIIGWCAQAAFAVPRESGRPKATAQVACAVIVMEAWALTHRGRTPGHMNLQAREACQDYWAACGGKGKPPGWQRHIGTALKRDRDRKWVAAYLRQGTK